MTSSYGSLMRLRVSDSDEAAAGALIYDRLRPHTPFTKIKLKRI